MSDRIDRELDVIFEITDLAFRKGCFSLVDLFLASPAMGTQSTEILVGWMTATLPAASKLNNRKSFFNDAKRAIERRGENDPGLLDGLEVSDA